MNIFAHFAPSLKEIHWLMLGYGGDMCYTFMLELFALPLSILTKNWPLASTWLLWSHPAAHNQIVQLCTHGHVTSSCESFLSFFLKKKTKQRKIPDLVRACSVYVDFQEEDRSWLYCWLTWHRVVVSVCGYWCALRNDDLECVNTPFCWMLLE